MRQGGEIAKPTVEDGKQLASGLFAAVHILDGLKNREDTPLLQVEKRGVGPEKK